MKKESRIWVSIIVIKKRDKYNIMKGECYMYCGYPMYCCQGNNEGSGFSWFWAIIIIIFIIFVLNGGFNSRNNAIC